MLTNLAQIQADALELARIECHVATGEPGSLWLQRWQSETSSYVDLAEIPRRWNYSERDYAGSQLPGMVSAELRISELALTSATLLQVGRFRHGERFFQAVPPSPFVPSASIRYWRFYLVSADGLQVYGTDVVYIQRQTTSYSTATSAPTISEVEYAIKGAFDDPIVRSVMGATGQITDVQDDESVLLVPGVELPFTPAVGDVVKINNRRYNVRRYSAYGRVGDRAVYYSLVLK